MSLATGARLRDSVKIDIVHDADGAYDQTAATMLDMQGYAGCMVICTTAATVVSATNHITALKIVSNSSSTGTGTDTELVRAVATDGATAAAITQADMGTTALTTLGDPVLVLDVKAEQMPTGDRYIGVISTKTGTLPVNFIFIRYGADIQHKDMYAATAKHWEYRLT